MIAYECNVHQGRQCMQCIIWTEPRFFIYTLVDRNIVNGQYFITLQNLSTPSPNISHNTEGNRGKERIEEEKMLQTSFIFHQTACNLKFLATNSQVEQIHSRFQALTELKLASWKVISSSPSLPPSVPPFPPPPPPFSILPWLFLPTEAEGTNCN